MAEKLIKQRADYKLLKTKHQTANNGTIYETDYFTTMRGDGYMGEQMDIYSESNFKFSINTTPNTERVHPTGNWYPNGTDDDGNAIDEWMLKDISTEEISSETKIERKSDYNSLRDFAYYGSALELVKASMNDIVMNFPAGIYFPKSSEENKFWISSKAGNYSKFTGSTGCASRNFGSTKSEIRMTRTGEILLGAGDEHDYSQDYFTITSRADNNEIRWACVFRYGKGIQIKGPGDTQWSSPKFSTQNGTTLTVLNSGESLYVWAEDDRWREDSFAGFDGNNFYYTYFKSDKPIDISGNIMSLISYDFANSYTLTEDYTFARLFDDCKVVNAEHLVLPATALTNYCYYGLFSGCTVMTTPPSILPADTLSNSCYRLMFNQCISLTSSPILPATNLADSCYYQMFFNCNSLINAPVLPARALSNSCYQFMFINCSSLNEPPELPADTLADYCYYGMFAHCTDLASTPSLSVTTLTSNCYAAMFFGCTKLTAAPDLPATQLPNACYQDMFHDCTSLSSITCSATTFADDSTRSWVDGVSDRGVFYTYNRDSESVWNTIGRGINGIPEDWCVDTYPCDDPELHIVGDSSITICYSDNTPKTITVESNTGWTASCPSNKVVFTSPTISSGDGSVAFYVNEQLSSQVSITFTYGDTGDTRFEYYTINQVEQPTFSISETSFDATGGTMHLNITCSPTATWVFDGGGYATNKSGTGPGTVSTPVAANNTHQDQTFTVSITITDNSVTEGQCVFTESTACTIAKKTYVDVSTNLIELCYDDTASHSFNIESNSSWHVSTSSQGVNFTTPTSGMNNGVVSFTTSQNLHSTFIIDVELDDGTDSESITVKKPSEPTLRVNPQTFYSVGGPLGLEINCEGNFEYRISTDSGNMSPNVVTGTGNGTVIVTPEPVVQPNTSYTQDKNFSVLVEVSAGTCTWNATTPITVRRQSEEPDAKFTPSEFNLCPNDTTGTFSITSNSGWTLSAPNTVTLSQTAGTGNDTVTFTLGNGFSSPEHVTVNINGSVKDTLVIRRKSEPSFTMSKTSFGSNGETTVIEITAPSGSSYRISSNKPERISGEITGNVGNDGTATEAPTILPNETTEVIDFDIIVAITSDTCTWSFTSSCTISGVDKTLDVTPVAYKVCDTDRTPKYLDIASNSSWVVSTTNPTAITLSDSSGNGDKRISFTVDGTIDSVETITVKLGDNSISKSVTVSQSTSPSCIIGPTVFDWEGGLINFQISAKDGSTWEYVCNNDRLSPQRMTGTVGVDADTFDVTVVPNNTYDDIPFNIRMTIPDEVCGGYDETIECVIHGKPEESYVVVCGETSYTLCYNDRTEKSFDVKSNATWTVTAGPKVHYSPTGGTGDGRVTFTVDEGITGTETMTVRLSGVEQGTVISIKQSNRPSISVSPSSFTNRGGYINISVVADTGTHWSLFGPYQESGIGPQTLRRSVAENESEFPKTEIITFRDVDCGWETSVSFTVRGKDVDDSGTYAYEIFNPFDIDILTTNVNTDVENPLRFFGLSLGDYTVDGDESKQPTWSPSNPYETACGIDTYEHGVFVGDACVNGVRVFVFYIDGTYHYLTVDSEYQFKNISLKQAIIDREWSKFDEFEHVLLDRTSNPIYTAYFDTPYETDYGYFYKREAYTWPSAGGFLPHLNTPEFMAYMDRLISLAAFYDGYWSDNIWRSMTHEAIKNLDWTFIREENGTVEDMSQIDSSKVKMITRLWGRNSDDIKSFIDNIKYTNKVSYDQKNNTPDYFLSDEVEISGIDPITLGLLTDNAYRTDNLNYSGLTTGFTAYETNSELFRRLRINHRYLGSVKGTREGVIAMLELLGINGDNCDYEINEYVTTASRFPNADTVNQMNFSRDSIVEKFANSEEVDDFEGLPVVRVSYTDSAITDYVIPWCDVNTNYDNGLYFQMYGGWGLRKEKEVFLAGAKRKIQSVNGKFGIYDETVQKLKYANNTDDLSNIPVNSIKQNDICYVQSTDNAITADTTGTTEEQEEAKLNEYLSHCYIWKQDSDSSYSWKPIFVNGSADEIDKTRAIYVATIVETTLGNNQHCGYMEYDGGYEYINRLNDIFGYLCDDFLDNPSAWAQISDNMKFGIDTEGSIDNEKCWFFVNDDIATGDASDGFVTDEVDGDPQLMVGFESGMTDCQWTTGMTYGDKLYSEEREKLDHLEETNSFSVINLKNMEIKFYYPDVPEISSSDTFWEEYRNYVDNIVMYYVKQMIPSTTILGYTFNKRPGADNQPENEEYGKVDNEIIINVG